jgi:predicted ArsR family transcriptional regulator
VTTDEPAPAEASGDLDAIAALAEPNRRALYDFVTAQRDWVSRDQAADGVGLRRGIAAHHLDRLAADGLLEIDYRHRSERRGPGSGRPAKVYRRSTAELGVTLPPRRYDLAGQLLAEAVDCARADDTPIADAVERAAQTEGRRIGTTAMESLGRRAGRAARRSGVVVQLRAQGFDPEVLADGRVVLHNCPFHSLAETHTDLVCGMNQSLLEGVLSAVDGTDLVARLEPEDGFCCVRLHPAATVSTAAPDQPASTPTPTTTR